MTLTQKTHYSSTVLPEVPRLLNLLDRNPASNTFGCFDRPYWLHRTKDFPSSSAQMSMWALALIYKHPFCNNRYHQSPALLEYALAAIKFTLNLQHKDGSFDEWYPNERGWAGPTAYVAHALIQTLEVLQDNIPKELRSQALQCFKSAALHLTHRDEGDILANHIALSLVVLKKAEVLFQEKIFSQAFEKFFNLFQNVQSPEGWSLEYDGADPGYLLGSLNFFCDLDKIWPHPDLKKIVAKGFEFLKYFTVPDGSWGGALGSRHTCHPYIYAVEYWSHQFIDAQLLRDYLRNSFSENLLLNPGDQEDPYLHYRIADYLRAEIVESLEEPHQAELPYSAKNFSKDFKEAKILIQNTEHYYIQINYGRGGVVRIFNKELKKLVLANNGFSITDETKSIFLSNLWQQEVMCTETSDGIHLQTSVPQIFNKKFTPLTFVAFRLTSLLMFNRRWAYYFKKAIRFFLITKAPTKTLQVLRKISWKNQESIKVSDQISGLDKKKNLHIYWGGEFYTRFVPQGSYCTAHELNWRPHHLRSNKKSEIYIEQILDKTNQTVQICVL